jgi:hypothetical protein
VIRHSPHCLATVAEYAQPMSHTKCVCVATDSKQNLIASQIITCLNIQETSDARTDEAENPIQAHATSNPGLAELL